MGYFCLNDYDVIAFDMDHTVVQYHLPALMKMIYRCLVEHLDKKKKYAPCLLNLDNFEKYQDLSVKGLIFDYTKGNFLKVDNEGHVLSCSHGLVQLSEAEIVADYGDDKQWPLFGTLSKTMMNSVGYAIMENYYLLPAIPLVSLLVDDADTKNKGRLHSYVSIWRDIAEAFDRNFNYKSFKARNALFMCELISSPEKYVKKCPQSVLEWIKNLRKTKLTSLVTHTFENLAEHLMKFVIGHDWKDYFDFIIGHANKPKFFYEEKKDRPFYTMNSDEELSDQKVAELQPHRFYLCGSSARLEKEVQRYLKLKELPKFVYFGDSIRSDIYAPTNFTAWHAVAILEELEGEEELSFKNNEIESEDTPKKKRKTDPKADKLFTTSNRWGSFFFHQNLGMESEGEKKNDEVEADGTEKKGEVTAKMSTFWSSVLQRYCKLAIPLLDYVSDLPIDHKFMYSGDEQMTFYPIHPDSFF